MYALKLFLVKTQCLHLKKMIRNSLIFYITLFGVFNCFSQEKDVQLNLSFIQQYCGGARPTKEMEEESQKAKPYADQKVYLVSSTGKAKCFKTDKHGKLKIKLKPGNYKLYEAWRYKHQVPQGFTKKQVDLDCLRSEWSKDWQVLEVKEDKTEVKEKYQLIFNCPWALPCLLESARPPMPQ